MAKKKKKRTWLGLVPLLLGVAVTPLALSAAGVLALSGPGALAALFPWTSLARSPLIHIPAAMTNSAGQYLMYLQFPLYGLLMFLIMRKHTLGVAALAVVILHSGGAVAASGLGHFNVLHAGY